MRYLSTGLTYAQIARQMGVSRHTIDTYLRRVRGKTGATSAAQIISLVLLDRPAATSADQQPAAVDGAGGR